MSITSVTSLSLNNSLTSTLQSEQSTLSQLTAQLTSEKEYTDLTDYNASDALSLINLQSAATQKQSYLAVIATASNNLSVYNTTLTDLETIASQAQSIANQNPTYSAATASEVLTQSNDFLNSVTADLNQNINGRFIYSGARYTTQPVPNLATLPASTLSSTIETDGATLPSYDSQYAVSALTMTGAGTGSTAVTVGGTVGTPQDASVTLSNGNTYTYAIKSTDSTADIAQGLANVINTAIPGTASTSGTSTLTISGLTIPAASAYAASTTAYTTDQATVDSGYTVNYGITSNDPAMQQLIAGMRYLQAAGNATDAATYSSDISQATTLLASSVTALQALNTNVADNINVMSSEKTAQNSAISGLTDQVDDISQIDVTQVSTEITSLETILQASYSVTGSILKLSIVSYL
jgi:flagellar hook-associated protein 3 FlgL